MTLCRGSLTLLLFLSLAARTAGLRPRQTNRRGMTVILTVILTHSVLQLSLAHLVTISASHAMLSITHVTLLLGTPAKCPDICYCLLLESECPRLVVRQVARREGDTGR